MQSDDGVGRRGQGNDKEGAGKEPVAADLALIAAAQRVEHYEIAAYGTARACSTGRAIEAARLLSRTLGEEESADFLSSAIADLCFSKPA